MRKLLPKKSKKGITLVESVVAVVLLAMFAIGVLTLLTSGGVKIQEISKDAAAYAEATQKLDLAISAISNGSSEYIDTSDESDWNLKPVDNPTKPDDCLKSIIGVDEVVVDRVFYKVGSSQDKTASNVRGWYLELTYKGVTVKGFASNSEGVFDS